MRNFVTLVVSTGFIATVAFGASSIKLDGPLGIGGVPGAIDVQTHVLKGSFGTQVNDRGPELVAFTDSRIASLMVPNLPVPSHGHFVDPTTDTDPASPLLGKGPRQCFASMSGGPRTLRAELPPVRSLRRSNVSNGFSGFGTSQPFFGSGGGSGGGDTPIIAEVPTLFDPDNVPTDNTKPPLGAPDDDHIAPVPVPSSLLLFGTALLGFGLMRRRTIS